MNIYFWGMCISFVVYILIGAAVSKKVKNADDYYVAGRKAPVLLVAGSMVASYASTSLFMGDAGQCYDGTFAPLILLSTMQVAGYIIGAIFFGRYLRRSGVMTIPDFFGYRFCSKKVKTLASVTAIITMIVYLLSVTQGVGTLMSAVTGLEYRWCIILSLIVFTIVTVIGGSSGVLITDTIMAALFTTALVVASFVIAHKTGGWFQSIQTITANPETAEYLSWGGNPGSLYETGVQNLIWGFVYGIVWMSVCMVGPWQSSRYLMAKNEHVVIRSAYISAIGVFLLEFFTGMASVMVNVVNPDLSESSHVLIWAAMNLMPKLLGVILLTGVLAAGISSATTFLSLVGASVANDLFEIKGNRAISFGRVVMVLVSAIVLALAIFQPPAILWITYFGGAIVASSWMPVAFASILMKSVTKKAAFCGMLAGFVGCFVMRVAAGILNISLPAYLDPSIVGMVLNVVVLLAVSSFTKVTDAESAARAKLMIVPKDELRPADTQKTLSVSKASIGLGALLGIFLLVMWVVPYVIAAH